MVDGKVAVHIGGEGDAVASGGALACCRGCLSEARGVYEMVSHDLVRVWSLRNPDSGLSDEVGYQGARRLGRC